MHDHPAAETELEALVAACIEAEARGDITGVEGLLAGRPDLQAAARAQLDDLRRTGLLDEQPAQIGNYRVIARLGSGGMGTVYLAEQLEPVQRRVALKLVKPGLQSRDVVGRFALERQSLAMMQHTNVAGVYDAGITADGRPYFVLEYVDGLSITDHADLHRLTTEARLRLFLQACEGVQHAHLRGVIHRDLKPSNILVAAVDGKPVPKIIDFGIAKVIDQRLSSMAQRTEHGMLLGTPEYMSPEQADGDAHGADLRTDVYSLGVVLYELLTGTLPFASDRLRTSRVEMRRILREEPPTMPSRRVAQASEAHAAARQSSITSLQRTLHGELDWIVLKAMEKEPQRRYESANALAQDLARHLAHEPVLAGPASTAYLLRKFARRYRVPLVAAAVVLVTAVIGTVVAIAYAQVATARKAEFDQLAGVVVYERTIADEQKLYPPWPHQVEAMQGWLRACDRLLAMRSEIERTVQGLRARALPQSGVERLAALNAELAGQQTWAFADQAPRFLHDTLCELLQKLARLERNERVAVEQRLQWAQRIGGLSRAHPGARVTWDQVRSTIAASAKYAGQAIELRDQDVVGLVPIGANPVTGLHEFYELRSAWDGTGDPADLPIPQHAADGTIEVTGATGIVFVLLPGGTTTMGAQHTSADLPHYDAEAEDDESPVHEITLAPFFLARHELTRGQWKRLSGGEEPSWHSFGVAHTGNPEPIDDAHAVEQVDWTRSDRLLTRHGLVLPTEAQWEYGCRAGTGTPWWPGATASELADCANLLDQAAVRVQPQWGRQEGDFDDERVTLGPVGSYRANAFGLFDVHGNVWEWCLDEYGSYSGAVRAGDGLRLQGDGSAKLVYRSGGFNAPASRARSASRYMHAATFNVSNLGLRAARALRP